MANQLSPSLVPIPASFDGIMKNPWPQKFPIVGSGRPEGTRVAIAQPIFPCQEQGIQTSVPMLFENGSNWQPSGGGGGQFHSSHVSGDANSANNRLQHLYLDPERESRRSANDNK